MTANTPVFGPTTYTRTTGAPNEYTTTFTAPAWIGSPFNLHIVNGDASGKNRISSATIALNGVQIAGPSDFNQNVATIDRSVTLQATNTLQVTLASKPGSYLTINVFGTNDDHTAPQIKIVSPANTGYVNTATPSIEVTYSDPVGTGEPGASGINPSTFKATLDGVDRTSLFTVRSTDASADIPANLTLSSGAHTLVVTLQDNAGNQATSTSQFTVDLGVPQIQVVQPVLGAYLSTFTPTISIQYSDSIGVNTSTLKVSINGIDETSLFTKTNTGATATPPANLLVQGANQIVAQIQNLAGTLGSASTSFNIDTTPPTISIAHPAANSYHGSPTVDITVQYGDDQAIDTTKLQVTLDGVPVNMSKTLASATGTVSNVANGPHSLAASIADLASNVSNTQVTFFVDTTIPTIHIDQPAPNAIVPTPTPMVSIGYTDIEGVDTTTLKVFLNGTDITSLFSITSSGATAQLGGATSLADGQNSIVAQISNFAGTQGSATSPFLVDTTPPTIVFQAPPQATKINTPPVTLSYSDAGSGVNPFSLVVTVDGMDVSSLIAPGPNSATGVLNLPLSDGNHVLSATISDRAGNKSQAATLPFVVDTKPPTVTFTSPADNSFINNPTPAIVLQYTDGTGTGVATSSIQVLLQQGSNPPTDITSYFQIGPQQATGAIPPAVSLNDGTYVLSAVVNDAVGNPGGAQATFVVDTVAPTSTIQAPAANAILNISSVPVIVTYADAGSGIDTSKIVLTVDGVNQTSVLTFTPTQATGTLPALPDGPHTIQLTVYDRSGNPAPLASQPFTIDTIAPLISASVSPQPNSANWNKTAVTVSFNCTDSGSGIQTCPAPVTFSNEGKGQQACGQAVDAAGNTSLSACATVNIDLTIPTITASVSPSPNANGIITSLPVTITFQCSDNLSGVAVCPSPITVSNPGLNQMFNGTAFDVAGNMNTIPVTVSIQTAAPTPPSIGFTISPPPNAKGWNKSPVTVTFQCAPGSNPLASCPSPIIINTEGMNQPACGKAIDNTGLSASTCAHISLDLTPPTITATPAPPPQSNTWNTSPVTVTFQCADNLSGVSFCPPPQTISNDGFHQSVTGTATDNADNNSLTVQLFINLDQTPPSILQFTAPTQLAPGQSGTAAVTATDNIGVASVVIQLTGPAVPTFTVATLTVAPYTATFTVPSSANAGDTLTLTATAYDLAGNVTSSARGIQVVPSGVVTGQVLSDTTGLPFTGATVQVIGANAQDTSDNTGRYSIPSNTSHLFLSVNSTANATTGAVATTTVEREVSLQTGVGTVPVDARLTQIAAAIPIGAAGGSLLNGSLTVSVAAGAVSSSTNFHLTTLSQQGLPGLLPLGWSPVAAFDLRADTATSASFSAAFTQLPNLTVHLVRYDFNSHSWLMVTPNLAATSGALTTSVPSVGDFALVTPDAGNNSPSLPSPGQPLTGVSMVGLPAGSAASGSLNPPSVSPTGGTSSAVLSVQSSVPLPSGTVIQAKVQDLYSLASGRQLSTSPRMEDVILYQLAAPSGSAGAAAFPVTASQTFQPGILSSGDVHLDILSGRESIRGQVGGSDAASVTGGDAILTVAAGSLPQDTAISVAPEGIDTFLPSTATLLPLAEYNIDLSGQILLSPAQLTVAAGSAKSGDTVVLAQIQRIQDVPYLIVVSLAQVNGSNLVTQAAPGFSGITQGGDYIFYKLTSPTGYVSGTVTAATGPVPALIQTNGLPFAAFASSSGSYVILAAAGPVNLTASVPNTAVSGTATAQVTAGQTATANITVTGQTETATVTPPNGAVGVPLTAEIDITAPDPLNEASVTTSSVTLVQNGQGTSTPVPVRFVFTQGDTRLSVFPLSALQPSTTYTLSASGLANAIGGLVSVPTVTFTTQAITPPNFNPDALVFGFPDQNGNVAISAPANSFPSGSTVLIVDQTNGIVLSLTVANDGSVTGQMPATIDDVLAVTITAPDKTTVTFTRSKFVAPDGTTAIGPGGGTVVGPSNTGLIIPAGALTKGTTFKLTPLDQTAFPVMPSFPGSMFAGGLHVDAPAMPIFSQEVKLAFPVPSNAPSNAFYYVYRRITDQAGNVSFDTIDEAFVQGTGANAQIVTSSPPFCGYRNAYGAIQGRTAGEVIAAIFQPFIDFIVLMEVPVFDANQPGAASQGLIVGKALQIVPPAPGQSTPTFVPVDGAIISLDFDPTRQAITAGSCGTFALFDPKFGGGSRSLTGTYNGQKLQSSTIEVNAFAQAGAQDATFGPFGVNAGTERNYKNIGTVTFTFAAPTPPPPPPQINIGISTLDNNGNRQPINGIVTTGTSLVLTFVSSATIQVVNASIDGAPFSTVVFDPVPNPNPAFHYYVLQDFYVAAFPGLHTIVASAVNPLTPNDTPITETRGFLAVQAGGSNDLTTTQPPGIIASDPQNNAQNVDPMSTTPSITFSEPVTNVTGNVTLTGQNPNGQNPGDPAHIQLVGFRTDGTIANPVQPTDKITSLTILHDGLQYSDVYTITLSTSIVDLNGKPLAPPYTITFNTFVPTDTGSTQSNNLLLTRPAIVGQRAYFGGMLPGGSGPVLGGPDVVDISDPTKPKDLGIPTAFVGRVTDAVAQVNSPVTPGSLLAISASFAIDNFIPSNIWLYQVPNPEICPVSQAPPACPSPLRIGAVSASSSAAQAGTALHLAIKDNLLFSSTSLQGLQVIDLQQALADYTAATPTAFGEAVSTEGEGFAMDAIVNTIQIPTTSGGSYTMFGLEVGDFPLANPATGAAANQALLVATGGLPFVVADPFKSGRAAVLYPPQDPNFTNGGLSNVPLTYTSPDGLTTVSLSFGAAVALGPITENVGVNGATTTQTVAVVVGSGFSSATGPGSFLMTVDMSQPYVPGAQPPYVPGSPYLPKPIGYLKLPKAGTDVILSGDTAYVATGTDVLFINLADPTNPRLSEDLKGTFGNKIGMATGQLLVGSGTIPGSPSPSNVQTALGSAYVRPDDLAPIFAKITQGDPYDPSTTPMYQLLSDVIITVSLQPANLAVSGGVLFVSGNGYSQNFPLSFDPTTGKAFVTLKKDTILPPVLSAKPNVISRDAVTRIPNQYTTATASFVVDATNDTKIVLVDDHKASHDKTNPKKFGFWLADPSNVDTQDGLVDYAMMHLSLPAQPDPTKGKLKFVMTGTRQAPLTPFWLLTSNLGVPPNTPSPTPAKMKMFLSDAATSASQLNQTLSSNRSVCTATTGFSVLTNLCVSGSGAIDVANLNNGEYDLVFSCQICAKDSSLQMKLVYSQSGQSDIDIDTAPIDIRPINNWIDAWSARDDDTATQDINTSDPEKQFRSNLIEASGWGYLQNPDDTQPTPPVNANVTVLVHGFSVSRDNALTSFIPTYTKRLYWAGSPVIPLQNTDHGPAYTVGIIWRGDHRNWNLFPAFTNSMFFPDDEFIALSSGKALAAYLDDLHGNKNDTINMVAHSLGNGIANSGIKQAKPQAVATYVMNEAAVSAEAFATDLAQVPTVLDFPITDPNVSPFLAPYRRMFLTEHAAQMGYSSDPLQNDNIWLQQLGTVLGNPIEKGIFDQAYGTVGFEQEPQGALDDYIYRWGTRPADTAPNTASPWLGYFAGNLSKTRLFNSYSFADCALIQAYVVNQLTQKPDRSILDSFSTMDQAMSGAASDARTGLRTSFPDSDRTDNPANQLWITLANKDQIHRLAYWYPARTGAAGSFDFQAIFGQNIINMTDFSTSMDPPPCSTYTTYFRMIDPVTGIPVPGSVIAFALGMGGHVAGTHSYMTANPFPAVFGAYRKLMQAWYPPSSYPTLQNPDQ